MSMNLCFYFQVHQPWRLRHYRFLEAGVNHDYFDEEKNRSILLKVAHKCYLPMNALLLELIEKHEGKFRVSFSLSGTVIQQMRQYAPEVLASFKRLFDTGCVELLSETSHHSLSALYSPREFREQVELHRELCTKHLVKPSRVFRNTELITSNAIASMIGSPDFLGGFDGMLMEGADHILGWRSPLFQYTLKDAPSVVAMMKNYRLSDDIAFRFSDRNWTQWPLTADKYVHWLDMIRCENPASAAGQDPFIGLFMDYETFGEHQWADTGIFEFMRALPGQVLEKGLGKFVTPTEVVKQVRKSKAKLNVVDAPQPFSWADVERDLSAWRGNPIQDASLRDIYSIEQVVRKMARKKGGAEFLETWRRLQTSDHFYYMCTKYFADGDVHKYFNPYESPYDAHIIYMNVMADMLMRCRQPKCESTERNLNP